VRREQREERREERGERREEREGAAEESLTLSVSHSLRAAREVFSLLSCGGGRGFAGSATLRRLLRRTSS
jgi:hypothetical protein